MPDPSRSVPAAILAGSALIAAAVYFGLRARPAPAPPNASQQQPAPPTDAAAPAADLGVVRAAVAQALEGQRASLALRCPLPPGPGPASARWIFDFTFDAQGHQLSRGASEQRGAARPEVTACVARELAPLQIPAPGAPAFVQVPFSLP